METEVIRVLYAKILWSIIFTDVGMEIEVREEQDLKA